MIAAGVAILVTLLLALRALDAIELPLRDAAMRLLPRRVANATVVVAIDEASLQRIGRWMILPHVTTGHVPGLVVGGRTFLSLHIEPSLGRRQPPAGTCLNRKMR